MASVCRSPRFALYSNSVLLLLALVPSLFAAVSAAHVHTLTPLTIDTYLSQSSTTPLLLEFYAPWCSHCKRFAQAYRAVAAELSSTATVACVDGSAHRLLALRFRVRGFPTFFLISKGRVIEYVGPRSEEAMIAFVRAGGAHDGKPHNFFFGPLGAYWKAVGMALRTVDSTYHKVQSLQLSRGAVAGVLTGGIGGLLLMFVTFIYFVTKPPVPKAPAASRPHAE